MFCWIRKYLQSKLCFKGHEICELGIKNIPETLLLLFTN